MRKPILMLLIGAMALGLVASCCGPLGSTRREVGEVRRTRDKEVDDMEAGHKAPE